MDYFSAITKEEFGWGLEEKYNQIQPEKRYAPLFMDIIRSKEHQNLKNFMEDEIPQDRAVRNLMREAEFIGRDYFRDFDAHGYRVSEIRERPSDEQRRKMGPRESDKHEINGIHIDNSDILDMGEDFENLWNDFADVMNPDTALMKRGIKLDAELRWSPKLQKLISMVMNDFGIKSENDLVDAVMRIAERVGEDVENCPFYRRSRLAGERMLRYAMKSLKVSDLEVSHEKRAKWINDLALKLKSIMASSNSVEQLENFVGHILEDFLREVGHYVERVDQLEQAYRPKI
jgi:hypothetical protein